jgi:hypothetical protein
LQACSSPVTLQHMQSLISYILQVLVSVWIQCNCISIIAVP